MELIVSLKKTMASYLNTRWAILDESFNLSYVHITQIPRHVSY